MIKKLIITILAATLFWTLAGDALAAIQLDDNLRPDNLPDIEVAETTDNANSETLATQTIVLFIGNIVSQVLLFAGAVSIIFLIIAGGNYILAFGKDEHIEKGKRGIFWSITGLFTILLSYSIVKAIIAVLLQLDG